jgi:hypothetical protein
MQPKKPTSAMRPTRLVRRVMPTLTIPAAPNSEKIAKHFLTRSGTDRRSRCTRFQGPRIGHESIPVRHPDVRQRLAVENLVVTNDAIEWKDEHRHAVGLIGRQRKTQPPPPTVRAEVRSPADIRARRRI